MPFDDRLKNEQTPQRVYSLCKLAKKERMDRDKIKNYLVPTGLNQHQDSFNNIFSFASSGKLISEDPIDGSIVVNLTDEELGSMDSFRKTINKRAFSQPDLMFCRFTAWYIARGTKVYGDNSQNLVNAFDREINIGRNLNLYNTTNLVGWRTWANYLGFGFIHNSTLIPNVAVRIQDCLEEDTKLERGKPILFKNFMKWLNETCPELDYGRISQDNRGDGEYGHNGLSAGISAGLRSLHNSGKIKLNYEGDSEDIWHLIKSELHEIQEEVSEVIIGRW